jgi:hypothetical protein
MISASDPADRADQMIAVGRRLIELVGQEALALMERRVAPSPATMEEKERLAHAWRIEVQRIRDNPELIAGLNPARRDALKAVSLELDQQLNRHAHALGAMRTVTEGLIKRIAEEIAAARKGPAGYGRSGGVEPATNAATGGTALNTRA